MPAFPVSRPTISGTNLTVDLYTKQPLVLARTIEAMRQNDYWLSDLLFHDGGMAESGAVVYQPITQLDDQFVLTTADIEDVAPGAEFPVLNTSNIAASVATTQKRGGKIQVTREMKTRNEINKFRNQVKALYNTAKRKADTKAVAVMNAASFISVSESAAWGTATTDIRYDILSARHQIENSTLGKAEGYMVDTLVLGSTQWFNVVKNTNIMNVYYQANMNADAQNLVKMGILDGFLGIPKVRLNPFITATDRWLFDGSRAGTKVTEYPLMLESWYEQDTQTDWFQLSESDAYFCEAPKALAKIV